MRVRLLAIVVCAAFTLGNEGGCDDGGGEITGVIACPACSMRVVNDQVEVRYLLEPRVNGEERERKLDDYKIFKFVVTGEDAAGGDATDSLPDLQIESSSFLGMEEVASIPLKNVVKPCAAYAMLESGSTVHETCRIPLQEAGQDVCSIAEDKRCK